MFNCNTVNRASTIVDFAPGLENAFFQEVLESDYRIDAIEGEIPEFVRGTYFLNGPATVDFAGMRYANWLDGDGMVCSLQFIGSDVFFRNRFVHGRKLVRETQQARRIYRTFGTAFDGDRLKRGIGTESPYNVSVFPYRNKLLAFGEQSLPMELNPVTLETVTPGRTFDFDGALNDAAPFSAHPKIDARNGELLNFGIFYSPDQPLLVYYRFDATGELACRSRIPIDLPCSLHDFAASENYVIFYLSPYILDTSGLTERGLATIDSLSWQPGLGSQLLVLCRETGREIARIAIDGRYCLHTINAFERDGKLVVDLIEFERPIYDQYQELPNLFIDVPYGQPVRFTIDLQRQQVVAKQSIDYRSAPDFPTLDPRSESREYDDFWMLGISPTGHSGRKFLDRLVHARWSEPDTVDVWIPPTGNYLGGEPVFIGDPDDSRRGVVLCHVFDALESSSRFAFFDARDVAAGPVASIQLTDAIHVAFHACFSVES
ncbi:MAG TPA: carotenoid oxygenase family protein [Pirellulaceae bacterium]|nr:carotenoid oxygenase family protein [Pirellulaceae bacterium]